MYRDGQHTCTLGTTTAVALAAKQLQLVTVTNYRLYLRIFIDYGVGASSASFHTLTHTTLLQLQFQ